MSRICASWPAGSAETHRKENYVSDKRSEPIDLHDSGQAYIPNPIQLKSYFDRLTKLL